MDDVLEALYEAPPDRGLGPSSPSVNRWLGDIRQYFPTPVVQLLQRDALDRLGLRQMLLEPELLESIEADIPLVATLLTLKESLPAQTRETAREVVRRIVKQLEAQLVQPLRQAVQGSRYRSLPKRRPRFQEIDWHRTIRANLKHYQPQYQTIIPEHLIGYSRRSPHLRQLILLVDQSGSMATSVVYAGVIGSILASLRSLETHLIVFDTSVVDLSEHLHDPVELLFATQLGGGTHIAKAMAYAQPRMRNPRETVFVLISDLMEGASEAELVRQAAAIQASGAQFITLLALNDQGAPRYDRAMAGHFAELGIPVFACSPDKFPGLMAALLHRQDIHQWLARANIAVKP
ncbi:MAG: VWA domain-containing protein [Lewinellaceae bacterium]|nr:VWA domain-containing protein [Lewinellaceae bacterium]